MDFFEKLYYLKGRKWVRHMKIEHIAMYVNDLEEAKGFFIKYLGGRSNNGYHNKTTKKIRISWENGYYYAE